MRPSGAGVASTYEWTADNRLKKATVASGDFKLPPQEVHYKYDYAGRRLLKHVGTAGQRTRHFFNGLTEEIKKVSVGTHADTSFAVTTMMESTSPICSARFGGDRYPRTGNPHWVPNRWVSSKPGTPQ